MDTRISIDKIPLPECGKCYYQGICMLTLFMRMNCGGPFKDKAAHLKYYDDEIMDKKIRR